MYSLHANLILIFFKMKLDIVSYKKFQIVNFRYAIKESVLGFTIPINFDSYLNKVNCIMNKNM